MKKGFVQLTLITFIISSIASLAVSTVSYGWGILTSELITDIIFYSFVVTALMSTVLNTYYFKKRLLNLPAWSNLALGMVGVCFTYLIHNYEANLHSQNLIIPILGILYLVSLLFYGLSFLITKRVRSFNFLKLHGVIVLIYLALNGVGVIFAIPYFGIGTLVISIVSNLTLILHFILEREDVELEMDVEEILDN